MSDKSVEEIAGGLNAEQQELCRRFASGRLTLFKCAEKTDRGFEERWRPKVAGRLVRNLDDPEHGYLTKSEARAAGARFRDGCRAVAAHLKRSNDNG